MVSQTDCHCPKKDFQITVLSHPLNPQQAGVFSASQDFLPLAFTLVLGKIASARWTRQPPITLQHRQGKSCKGPGGMGFGVLLSNMSWLFMLEIVVVLVQQDVKLSRCPKPKIPLLWYVIYFDCSDGAYYSLVNVSLLIKIDHCYDMW